MKTLAYYKTLNRVGKQIPELSKLDKRVERDLSQLLERMERNIESARELLDECKSGRGN